MQGIHSCIDAGHRYNFHEIIRAAVAAVMHIANFLIL